MALTSIPPGPKRGAAKVEAIRAITAVNFMFFIIK
jgi:hypothetical protein